MNDSEFRFGFRIVGPTCEPRRLIDAGAAFAAYCDNDPRTECHKESYLSAFWFGPEFRQHLESTGSTANYLGPCWSPWLWFDIDSESDLAMAQAEGEALVETLTLRFGVPSGELLIFFSGAKGVHIGLSTGLWLPAPSTDFHRTARRFAENIAAAAAVTIDTGVYDRVRAFRAPNSKHPRTGLHKRRLTYDELLGSLDAIVKLATAPARFNVPTCSATSDQAAADWHAAAALVAAEGKAKAARRAAGNGTPTLNRSTLDFIREGAATGDRHRLLFSAAANLAEFGCSPALAYALLEESALDSGLAPKEVRRQVECGLAAAGAAPTQQAAAESTQAAPDGSTVQAVSEAVTSDSTGSEGQSCQQVTPLPLPTDAPAAVDLQAALARLWGGSPAPPSDQAEDRPQSPTLDADAGRAVLPADPPRLIPLPPGAVGTGTLDTPCRCGSTEFAEVPITEGRTRLDCRNCGRFVGWGKWSDQGGPTP